MFELMSVPMSLMNSKNRMGPRTEPWGTPEVTGMLSARRSPLQPLVGSGLSGSPQTSWGFCLVYRICWALWGASHVTPCQRPCWSPSQCNRPACGPKALCGGHGQSQWAGCHMTGPPWSHVAQAGMRIPLFQMSVDLAHHNHDNVLKHLRADAGGDFPS